jgi:hypothetical protein
MPKFITDATRTVGLAARLAGEIPNSVLSALWSRVLVVTDADIQRLDDVAPFISIGRRQRSSMEGQCSPESNHAGIVEARRRPIRKIIHRVSASSDAMQCG